MKWFVAFSFLVFAVMFPAGVVFVMNHVGHVSLLIFSLIIAFHPKVENETKLNIHVLCLAFVAVNFYPILFLEPYLTFTDKTFTLIFDKLSIFNNYGLYDN